MQVAVRSYLAAGMATVGAGAIALSPVSPVIPADMHLPSVHVAMPVQLAAAVNPIEAYLELVQNTLTNLSSLGQSVLENPAPILRQIVANQLANGGALLASLQDAGGQLLENVGTIVPEQLQQALANLAAGNIVGVGQNLVNVIVQPILFPTLTLLPALQSFLEAPVANLLAVTQQFTTISALAGLGALSPLASSINATAQAIQNVVDSARALDPVGVVSAIVAAPAIVAGGLLNGFGFDGGVLSPGLGLAGALLQIRNVIAQALGTPAVTTSGLAAADATTTKAATTVTLSTDSVATAPQKSAASKADAETTGGAAATTDATGSGAKDATSDEASTSTTSTTSEATDSKTDASATKDTAASDDAGTKAGAGSTTAKDDTGSTDATSKGDTANGASAKDDASATKADNDGKATSTTSTTKKDADGKKDADSKEAAKTAKAGSE
jgi:hypothetical protein